MRKINGDSYRSLVESVENMSDSFVTLDSKWRYKYINRNAEKILGCKRENLIGKNMFKLFPKKTLLYINAKKSIKTNKATKFETYSPELNKWLEVRVYPLQNAISFYFTDIGIRKKAELRQEFISKINSAIALSLDYNVALQNAAKVIVKYLADYCRIIILEENGKIKEINADHSNPKKVNLKVKLYENYKDINNANYGINQILREGKPEILSQINYKLLKNFKIKNLKSYMGVPLIVRGNIIGAITLYSTKLNILYGKDALALVGGVASRIALAIDNMRLFEKVKIEQERMEFGQNAGKIGTFEWDIENNKSTWSQGFAALFGNPPISENASIDEWLSMADPQDREMIRKEKEKAIKDGDRLLLKFKIVWLDNSTNYLSIKAKTIRDKTGNAIRMNGVAIDITRRINTENNLRFLAEASKILSSSLDYNLTLDSVAKLAVPHIADWCTIDMVDKNGQLERITVAHKNPEKVKWAKTLYKENPPDMNASHGLPNVLRTGVPELIPLITDDLLVKRTCNKKQLKLARSIGSHSAMIVPLTYRQKTIGGITFVTTKESNKQYTQEDLVIAQELASRASLAIENARLYQKAQNASRLKEEFISIASHELKTPITSLKVYAQVLNQQAQRQGNTDMSRCLLRMDQQVDKLNKLIRDLLDASRMQLGRLAFRKRYFDIDEITKEVAEAIQLTTKNHHIAINGSGGKVFGDKERIGQVLINLLTNAIKYSPEANKVIVNLAKADSKVIVNVKDFGIGIDKENQQKIFQRFYQVDDSPQKAFSGLGIGLYISTEIVKRHGGNLWVESAKGKGSTFSFAIPLKSHHLVS